MIYRAWALLALLALAACQGETSRPVPTGKGAVRMINALDNAPPVAFVIEERLLETVPGGQGSGIVRWDDFEYNFNFEVSVLGQLQSERIATEVLKVEADREFALVLTGSYEDPTVTVWETAERPFDGSEAVFEARFTHLASAGSADFYFLPEGEAPAADNSLGSLSSGEFLDPVDIEAGEYVLTITEAGSPSAVLFQSEAGAFESSVVTTFVLTDGSAAETAPYAVQLIGNNGGGATLRDARSNPTVRLFHASITLPDADVYEGDDFTTVFVADHRFGDVTGDLSIATGANPYTYTAVGNSSVTLFETGINTTVGQRYNLVIIGDDSDRTEAGYPIDRSSIDAEARLLIFQASSNHRDVDVYITQRDAGFEGTGLTLGSLDFGQFNTISIGPRELDIYITISGEETVLAGPLPLDLELGDFVEMILLDTVDPATAELRIVPAP